MFWRYLFNLNVLYNIMQLSIFNQIWGDLNDAVPVVALFCKDYYAKVLGSMQGVVMLILAYFLPLDVNYCSHGYQKTIKLKTVNNL